MAQYSLFVLKVPLNTNQPTNVNLLTQVLVWLDKFVDIC